MDINPTTSELLKTLDTLSGKKLTQRTDLGALIELAAVHQQQSVLNELGFLAKFVSKTYGIMQRIGKDAEGYDTLARQFAENLEKAKALIRVLIGKGPGDSQHQFELKYFALTPSALHSLLALLYDLSWYKNWQIDNR